MTRKTAQAGTATLFADPVQSGVKAGDKVTMSGKSGEGRVVSQVTAKRRRQEVAVAPKQQAVAKAEPAPVNMLAVLVQLASDPRVPTEKMRDILDMQKEIRAEEARRAFTIAKIAMRPKLPTINAKGLIDVPGKPGKTGYKVPHARMIDINDAIKPILDEFGFDLWFEPTESSEPGRLKMISHLDHIEGYGVKCDVPMSIDASGGKNNQQGVGSSFKYGQRYGTMFLLNLDSKAPQDADDDAAAAGKMERDNRAAGKDVEVIALTKKQVTDLKAAIEDCGVGTETFCGKYEIDSVEELPPKLLGEAMTACRNFKANQKAARHD